MWSVANTQLVAVFLPVAVSTVSALSHPKSVHADKNRGDKWRLCFHWACGGQRGILIKWPGSINGPTTVMNNCQWFHISPAVNEHARCCRQLIDGDTRDTRPMSTRVMMSDRRRLILSHRILELDEWNSQAETFDCYRKATQADVEPQSKLDSGPM